MVFSSPAFIFGFLPILLGVYFVTPLRFRNAVLLVASLLFYFADAGVLTAILVGSIVFNHLIALHIFNSSGLTKRVSLSIGIAANLTPLLFYKYWVFFVHSANDAAALIGSATHFEIPHILLPAGISFFTFHAISYLVDVYNRKVTPASSLVDFGMYMSNFPQLIAGPIVRYAEIVDVVRDRRITLDQVYSGCLVFIIGLSKKVILADNVGGVADSVFGLPQGAMTTQVAWIGAFAYSLQIYFDFSGYSDMAIGLGRIMGFEFPQNFNQPYRSHSVTEFWRRWHMTLSRWFRDYVYIPLGGNRAGRVRTLANLFLVFFLCGLWHGAAYTFIVWGIYHGSLLIVERVLRSRFNFSPSGLFGQASTFLLVMLGWVLFRASSLPVAINYLAIMAGLPAHVASVQTTPPFSLGTDQLAFLIVGAACVFFPTERLHAAATPEYLVTFAKSAIAILLALFSCTLIAANGFNPFIYFRF